MVRICAYYTRMNNTTDNGWFWNGLGLTQLADLACRAFGLVMKLIGL